MLNNILLIGMPGAGKSTVGVLLAKELAMGYIDTDIPIQTSQGKSLQYIVETQGYLALREIEQSVLLGLNLDNHVIATGGSAVYSDAAMQHLKQNSLCVFLDVSLESLQARIHNYATRGLAKPESQSIEQLFQERQALYERYMDVKVDCEKLSIDQVCGKVISMVQEKTA